jgi:hypothetical protein
MSGTMLAVVKPQAPPGAELNPANENMSAIVREAGSHCAIFARQFRCRVAVTARLSSGTVSAESMRLFFRRTALRFRDGRLFRLIVIFGSVAREDDLASVSSAPTLHSVRAMSCENWC